MSGKKNAIILDFFAGSGTTLHAVMALNEEDGGRRQCILVTNNENNICEDVTYQRNKRVIEGYTNAKGESVAGLSGNALRYYRCGFVAREASLANKRALVRAATALLCLREDCYQELACPTEAVRYFVGEAGKRFMVVYEEEAVGEAVDVIQANLSPSPKEGEPKIRVYVFSYNAYPHTADFEDVLDSVELCALPDAIYEAYRQVLPAPDAPVLPTLDEGLPTEPNPTLFL